MENIEEMKNKVNNNKKEIKKTLLYNILASCVYMAGGIGLFRSEFLYLESNDYPTEEQQFAAYKKVLESMAGKKVIKIRKFCFCTIVHGDMVLGHKLFHFAA